MPIQPAREARKPLQASVLRVAALAALVALILIERYYKLNPHLLEHQLGNTGMELLFLGIGFLLLWQAIAGVRNGTITSNYTSSQYVRSDNALMFWFFVTFDFAVGLFLLFGSVGLLFGFLDA